MIPMCLGDILTYPDPQDFRIVSRKGGFGQGVICYRRFEAGDMISEMKGEIIDHMTQHSLQIEPGVHLLDLNFAGYFLHSCSPNVFLDMKELRVYATKTIHENEFLEMDYAQTEDVLFKQFACQCGATNCRGWITGSKEAAMQADPDFQVYLQKQAFVA
ncbi:MAG: SET domain-containing protein-lysine N-methyltransferase [Pirellulaceae bacterium]